jgi:uncharacterized protein YecE (DUF72 family)
MGTVRVGISGWRYPSWRGDFYPAGLPQRRELEYAAERLGSVEINGSFYSLQRPDSYRRWRAEVPPDFVFAVKGGRYITHLKRLRDVDAALANFFASGLLALGPTLGPVLWQLPERMDFDPEVLDEFLGLLPRTTAEAAALAARHDDKLADDRVLTEAESDRPLRHALEFRNVTFAAPAAYALLREHGVACVVADTAGRWPQVFEVTSDLVYVRLHGEERLYGGGYSPDSLDRWARRCLDWQASGLDVVVYFDNDIDGRAPYDALALAERLNRPRARGSARSSSPPTCA